MEKASKTTNLCNSFPPAIGLLPRILILGSMPGVESLRQQKYYAFKHNAFWKIMGELCHFSPELPYPERLKALTSHKVALWDTLQYCERAGSLDTAIAKPEPNAIKDLLQNNPCIEKICCNGTASHRYLHRFFPHIAIPVVQLPSTSPAAARMRYPEKLECWRAEIQPFL